MNHPLLEICTSAGAPEQCYQMTGSQTAMCELEEFWTSAGAPEQCYQMTGSQTAMCELEEFWTACYKERGF